MENPNTNDPQPSTSTFATNWEKLVNLDLETAWSMPSPQNPIAINTNKNTQSQLEIHQSHESLSQSENNKIPETNDAIDRQLKQFFIRKTPGDTYRVDDRSKGKIIIKDVWIPINDTTNQIIQFLKEHTIPDRIFYCYFYHEEYYQMFCDVYKSIFDQRGPKLIRCTSRVTLITNVNEQTDLIRKHHEGKTHTYTEVYKKHISNYIEMTTGQTC